VARRRPRINTKAPLPPALPPGERTVGQLVAETIRFYGSHFWRSLLLGTGVAALAVAAAPLGRTARIAIVVPAGAAVFSCTLAAAAFLVAGRRFERTPFVNAALAGLLVYIPLPVLSLLFILPALAWLAFVGLAVPAAVVEDARVRAALRRGMELARAGYAHALGSLAALGIVIVLCQWVLFFLLRGAGEAAIVVAALVAQLIISPLFFIGMALLYFDHAARAVRSRPHPRRRSEDAEVRAADHPHRAGGADPEGEPGPAA
jgi:hypothetical protein